MIVPIIIGALVLTGIVAVIAYNVGYGAGTNDASLELERAKFNAAKLAGEPKVDG